MIDKRWTLVVLCALVGCAPEVQVPEATHSSAAKQVDDSPSSQASQSLLRADETSRSEAIATAEAAMAAFARSDLPVAEWWAGLAPFLSANAAVAYQTVDPSTVPASEVTGPGELPNWDTPGVARVGVPTDVGVYLVVVSRNELDPVWRVERLVPPEVLDA